MACKMTINKTLQFGRSILPYNEERYRRINIYNQLLPCDLVRPVAIVSGLMRLFGGPFLRLYSSSKISQSPEYSDVILSDNDIEIIKRHTLACKVEYLAKILEKILIFVPLPRLESSYCAPKIFGAHCKTSVRKRKKVGAQRAWNTGILITLSKKSYEPPFQCNFGAHIDFSLGVQNFISRLTFGVQLMNFPTWPPSPALQYNVDSSCAIVQCKDTAK